MGSNQWGLFEAKLGNYNANVHGGEVMYTQLHLVNFQTKFKSHLCPIAQTVGAQWGGIQYDDYIATVSVNRETDSYQGNAFTIQTVSNRIGISRWIHWLAIGIS